MNKTLISTDSKEYALAEKFAKTEYWRPEYSDMFSDNLIMALPYAPPGMLQTLTNHECKSHFKWLHRTVFDWKFSEDPIVLATDHPGIFWIFHEGSGRVKWAKRAGGFKSRFATLLKITNGKIEFIKDHFDMVAFYDAIGVELPVFDYSAPNPETIPERKALQKMEHTWESLEKQIEATLNFFINPNYWDPDVDQVLADDFMHELVFAPRNMPRVYNRDEYDSINAWLAEHIISCDIYPDVLFYNTSNPNIYIAEFGCLCETSWSNTYGFYTNREISFIVLNNHGLCVRLDEYFNTISKFNSIGVSIPSFPYLF